MLDTFLTILVLESIGSIPRRSLLLVREYV